MDLHMPQPGLHMVRTALCALAVGREFGVEDDDIKRAIEGFTPAKNRMNIIIANNMTVLNDVYNASPASMAAGLDILARVPGRKVCVLGDMFELGESQGSTTLKWAPMRQSWALTL